MADWRDIPNNSIDPDAPLRSIDAFALRDNPIAIAQRSTGAPRVQPFDTELLTGSGTYTVADGVTRIRVWRSGGGGGGGGVGTGLSSLPNGGNGNATSFGSLPSAAGGRGGKGADVDNTDFVMLNENGLSVGGLNGSLSGAVGGMGGSRSQNSGAAVGGNGSPGQMLVTTLSVSPGDEFSYSVGSGGSGGSSLANGSQGASGFIMVES